MSHSFRPNIVNVPVNERGGLIQFQLTCERSTRMKINVETTVAAPIEQVWRAYTTLAEIKQWNAASDDWHTTAASVDLREGGAFSSRMEAKDGSMGFDFAGTYTKIVEHKLIEYSFGDRMAQVEFTPDPKGVWVASARARARKRRIFLGGTAQARPDLLRAASRRLRRV